MAQADISLICVGTPSSADGGPKLGYVEAVTHDIGRGLKDISHYHMVCLRSTVFPGTSRNFLARIPEENFGKQAGENFGLAMNPEFFCVKAMRSMILTALLIPLLAS
jgi:GDP-mannose 6-dehydrogenase